MIYNERQYKITASQVATLRNNLAQLRDADTPEWIEKAQHDAIASQIADLVGQMKEYELLKQGKIRFSEVADLGTLPRILIQARIAKGLSQKELAKELGVPEQQIQRYEASGYSGASLSRLIEISKILGISFSQSWGGDNASPGNAIYEWNGIASVDWNSFPVKEMVKKGWLKLTHEKPISESVREFFRETSADHYLSALHRKKFHGENKPDQFALIAWQARVLSLARQELDTGSVKTFSSDKEWLADLSRVSREPNAPAKAKDILAGKGIILVIEDHLSKTYLDGAAMKLESGHPVVALTLRHDRLDNFWFVLFHELAHVYLHLSDSLNMDFFDEANGEAKDTIESEADSFALEHLIPSNLWEESIARFAMTKESVEIDAEQFGVHPSIVAGRIRKERGKYTILNDLVGQGQVRSLLSRNS